ncbi:TlpA family protein disulfide reductase [Micromonospora sp. HNM0581]|uniref:TlpA family protein disulfide reductase n=1 Tax=Micromonospora sp. HNM0581 TaxID=2716341 RepID=UPI00146CDFD8|nr:TlpA disulfide reductase family protein [Micromonospora sp. HNM0581]NLU80167.1 TlpA family protein disulfide reductase [Micromonospora sp. HNM0581]
MGLRRLAAGLLATVLLLTGCTGVRAADCDSVGGIVECAPGQRSAAPTIAGELLGGGAYDVAEQRGNVVVVNFWGSWCAPCRAEADDLENTYQATRDSGVTFLGINVQDSRDKAIAFEEGRVSYPSIFDPGSRLALDMDIPPNTIPATVVLDRQGRIATVIRAAVRQEGLQPIVERIAAEASASAGQR